MPTNLLNVPHYEQAEAGSCLPACARMVLAFWQYETSEAELARLLSTQSFGTPAPHVRRLEQWGFSVTYESGSLAILKAHLLNKKPCLVFVQTGDLPYWHENVAHAVVAIGIDETILFINNPAFAHAPQITPIDDFLLAWSEFDYRYALIRPK